MRCILQGFTKQITIGEKTSIAPNWQLLTDSGPNTSSLLQKIYQLKAGEINIGNHCWIGSLCIIMPDVKIPSFTVIGAHSLVNQTLESYTVNAGVPTKVIKKLEKELLI